MLARAASGSVTRHVLQGARREVRLRAACGYVRIVRRRTALRRRAGALAPPCIVPAALASAASFAACRGPGSVHACTPILVWSGAKGDRDAPWRRYGVSRGSRAGTLNHSTADSARPRAGGRRQSTASRPACDPRRASWRCAWRGGGARRAPWGATPLPRLVLSSTARASRPRPAPRRPERRAAARARARGEVIPRAARGDARRAAPCGPGQLCRRRPAAAVCMACRVPDALRAARAHAQVGRTYTRSATSSAPLPRRGA
jgi:hypothetical protein